MGFGFHELIAHAARTRNLHPGTIIGSGTISNYDYRTVGSSCIAERRGIESVDRVILLRSRSVSAARPTKSDIG
jgi:fumarylacetoacetate (FAA) hydrolase